VLGGGEDYELIATLPSAETADAVRAELDEAFGVPLSEIGEIDGGHGLVAVEADGQEHPLTPAGWDHFR
jgi:thiamine monophosphate kinase